MKLHHKGNRKRQANVGASLVCLQKLETSTENQIHQGMIFVTGSTFVLIRQQLFDNFDSRTRERVTPSSRSQSRRRFFGPAQSGIAIRRPPDNNICRLTHKVLGVGTMMFLLPGEGGWRCAFTCFFTCCPFCCFVQSHHCDHSWKTGQNTKSLAR